MRGHELEHAIQTVVQVFFPNEGYKRLDAAPEGGRFVLSDFDGGDFWGYVYEGTTMLARDRAPLVDNGKRHRTQAAAAAVFRALEQLTGYSPPWGTLTGVRPAKILTEMAMDGHSLNLAAEYLRSSYLVQDDKVELAVRVAEAELKFLEMCGADEVGVYVGIPFCPSICAYCSFGSVEMGRVKSLVEPYLTALLREIRFLGDILTRRKVAAVYVGGGTPASLTAAQLEHLLGAIRQNFPGEYEFCVEAGRPDVLDADKLAAFRDHGVGRIAINCQSMRDDTLKRIGRGHSADDFKRAFALATDMGFTNINCDVIMGLPGEDAEDAAYTFRELAALAPASVTVHTLALKRAARFNHCYGRYGGDYLSGPTGAMLALARSACCDMGLLPYYMYRQKNMVGNLENVGYARRGFESLYNHISMTELRDVYAAGAGAVTKVIDPVTGYLRRAFNVKPLDEYITNVDEMIERKRRLIK